MCASYGLTRDSRRRRKMERDGNDLFGEPEFFNEKVDAWLDDLPDVPDPIRPTGSRALNFAPIVTAAGPQLAWWGLWVGGKPGKFSTINATVERLTAGLWKRPFASGRVLIPASHYYEYRDEGGPKKQRYEFHLPDRELFFFAGVSAPAYEATDLSYSMITREPTEHAAVIHNRMPMLLPVSFYDTWLDPARVGDDDLRAEALAESEEIVERLDFVRS